MCCYLQNSCYHSKIFGRYFIKKWVTLTNMSLQRKPLCVVMKFRLWIKMWHWESVPATVSLMTSQYLKYYLWVISVVALRNITFWCSMTCQSLDFITQYLTIHDVTESYAGNRLKFKVDQCIFILETGEFIDITSHITVWYWYVNIVRSGGVGALLVHPAVRAGFPFRSMWPQPPSQLQLLLCFSSFLYSPRSETLDCS